MVSAMPTSTCIVNASTLGAASLSSVGRIAPCCSRTISGGGSAAALTLRVSASSRCTCDLGHVHLRAVRLHAHLDLEVDALDRDRCLHCIPLVNLAGMDEPDSSGAAVS